MKIEIKSTAGGVLFAGEYETLCSAVEAAVKAGAALERADLSRADLSCANLRGANLRYANLRYANLCGAALRYANLCGAALRSADLRCADLCGAHLSCADLIGADLSGADLSRVSLSGAHLSSTLGIRYAVVSFAGHGECGRQLLGVETPEGLRFFCGCFQGTETELRDYIKAGDKIYRPSRRVAMTAVLKLLKIKRATPKS